MQSSSIYIFIIVLIACSCNAIKETSKHQLESGIYKVKNLQKKKYYAVVTEDAITLHPLKKTPNGLRPDTITTTINLTDTFARNSFRLTRRSFDIDVLSILFKYRPSVSSFPGQLNTNFNAAGYVGFRSDKYIISFKKDPFQKYNTNINHFAYSIGFFTGLGSTQMNQFVTNNSIQSEYDGVVFTKGLAGLIGIGGLTFGAAVGFDNLLDQNKSSWIYETKPWVGFTVGLNLN